MFRRAFCSGESGISVRGKQHYSLIPSLAHPPVRVAIILRTQGGQKISANIFLVAVLFSLSGALTQGSARTRNCSLLIFGTFLG